MTVVNDLIQTRAFAAEFNDDLGVHCAWGVVAGQAFECRVLENDGVEVPRQHALSCLSIEHT